MPEEVKNVDEDGNLVCLCDSCLCHILVETGEGEKLNRCVFGFKLSNHDIVVKCNKYNKHNKVTGMPEGQLKKQP